MSGVPVRAAVYVRISDDADGRGVGGARQEVDCRGAGGGRGRGGGGGVGGQVDLGSGGGRFVARVLGARAQLESDDKRRRLRRKHEELAAAGKVSGGGWRPFGFEPDRRTVREAEATLIRQAAERLPAGGSKRSLLR